MNDKIRIKPIKNNPQIDISSCEFYKISLNLYPDTIFDIIWSIFSNDYSIKINNLNSVNYEYDTVNISYSIYDSVIFIELSNLMFMRKYDSNSLLIYSPDLQEYKMIIANKLALSNWIIILYKFV